MFLGDETVRPVKTKTGTAKNGLGHRAMTKIYIDHALDRSAYGLLVCGEGEEGGGEKKGYPNHRDSEFPIHD